MKKILKWQLNLTPDEVQELSVPLDASFLTAQMQADKLVLWFECSVDPAREYELRKFVLRWTGVAYKGDRDTVYKTTIQHEGLVHHIFEVLF